MDIEKKIANLIKYWIAPNIIEALFLIVVYILLPKDPKNAWLFGYSKTRIFILGGILAYILVLVYFFIWFFSPSQKLQKALQKLKSHPSTNCSVEVICGVCLLLIYACGFYFFNVIPTNQAIDAIHIRIIPLVANLSLFIIQLFIMILWFRLILRGERVTLKNICRNATLPIIREKVFKKMDSFVSFTAENLSKPFLTLLFIFTPVILTTAFTWTHFTTTIFSYLPARVNDERDYWHETLTFVHHGFSGGQYSYGEIPAEVEFSHFGTHGPSYPVIYGLIGRLIGWEYYSGPLINLLLITLALWIVTLSVRLSNKQLVFGSILFGTYWPLLLYIPMTMTESLNHVIAIFLSILFYKQLNTSRNKWKIITPIFLILLISTTLRVIWSFLFLPFFLMLIFDYRVYKIWGAILLSLFGVYLGLLFYNYFYAPYPALYSRILSSQLTIQQILYPLWRNIIINVTNLIDELNYPFYLQAFRFQIMGFLIFIVAKVIKFFKNEEHAINKIIRSELGFHFLNILLPFASVFIGYQFRNMLDYRMLSASFLLSALILLLSARYKYLFPIIITNALLFFSFISGFDQYLSVSFNTDEYRIRAFSNDVSDYVIFDETQDNHWCNSLGFYQTGWNLPLISVDAGIGISVIGDLSEKTKSRYILLEKEYVSESLEYINSLSLVRLTKTNIGILYLNPNTACD